MAQLNNLLVTGAARFLNKINGDVSGTSSNVTGIVAVPNGGTGETSANDAANAFINALGSASATPTDNTNIITQNTSGLTTYHRRPLSALWDYIMNKVKGLPTWVSTPTDSTYFTREDNSALGKSAFSKIWDYINGKLVSPGMNPNAIYAVSTGTSIKANAAAIIQSPIPKYLWHDLFAFCRLATPKYYTTTDGTTWTQGTLAKQLFIHKETISPVPIINTSISGSRWVWLAGNGYSSCTWLVLGVSYSSNIAKFDVLLESFSGSDETVTGTVLGRAENINVNQNPIWIKVNGNGAEGNLRLTITRNSSSDDTTILPIVSIRLLTPRWGDQGKGSEYEYPYAWNETPDIYPIWNNTQMLGLSSYKWKDVYTAKLNGTTIPESPKFTDTTYESKTAESGGTDVSLVTTGEKATWNNKLSSHQTIKQDGITGATVNRFGTCSTAAATAAKAVSITTGTFNLEAGARVSVKFSNTNTANSPTLNVNSKGAKNIFHKGAQITSGSNKALLAGVVDFIYDGTQWHLIGNYIDSDSNTHRPIQVNGTEILGNNTTALNLKAGANVSVTNSSGTVTFAATQPKVSVGSSAPSTASSGDIWFKLS